MPFVLDSSTTVTWAFEDEDHPVADASYSLLFSQSAIVPLWWYEVRNTLLVGETPRRISDTDAMPFLGALSRLPIAISGSPDDATAFHYARKHRLTFYDATYLALASREQTKLASLDHALVAAARAKGIGLVEPQMRDAYQAHAASASA